MIDKTVKVAINTKDDLDFESCGHCFSLIEEQDLYCWCCGYYFDTEYDAVQNYNELYKYMTQPKEEDGIS